MIHCTFGKNRSPAVGIALNEIFLIGYDTKNLKEEFPGYNVYVYEKLMQAAKKIT